MSLANYYRNIAEMSNTSLPIELKQHIEDKISNAAARGQFETFYVVPHKLSHMDEAIKAFLRKEGFSFEFSSDYQGKSFKIKF